MNAIKRIGVTALLGLLVAGGLSGCGTLNSSGVYAGDKALYDADLTIASSYELLHGFVKFEYDNRALLAGSPEVKQYADHVRKGAPQWFASAIALRDAYKGNPNDGTRTALQQALDVLREATVQATRYLTVNNKALAPPQ
jgi:hypothetical protein